LKENHGLHHADDGQLLAALSRHYGTDLAFSADAIRNKAKLAALVPAPKRSLDSWLATQSSIMRAGKDGQGHNLWRLTSMSSSTEDSLPNPSRSPAVSAYIEHARQFGDARSVYEAAEESFSATELGYLAAQLRATEPTADSAYHWQGNGQARRKVKWPAFRLTPAERDRLARRLITLAVDDKMAARYLGTNVAYVRSVRRAMADNTEATEVPVPELPPIPDDINHEDRLKLVYIVDQLGSGEREREDVDLLRETYTEILNRHGRLRPRLVGPFEAVLSVVKRGTGTFPHPADSRRKSLVPIGRFEARSKRADPPLCHPHGRTSGHG
jgi:hypothetical protein